MLPAIFDGRYEALGMYQLATLARLNYTADPSVAFATIQHGTGRRHTRTVLDTAGGNPMPRTTVLENADFKTVIVRGTSETTDWFAQFAAKNEQAGLAAGERVASTWFPQAQALYAAIFPSSAQKEKPCLFVGHSSGGSIALLMAYIRRSEPDGWTTAAATFGAPKCMNQAAASKLPYPQVFRVVNQFDYVDHLPPRGFSAGIPGTDVAAGYNAYIHSGRLLALLQSPRREAWFREGESRSLKDIAASVIQTRTRDIFNYDTAVYMHNAGNNTIEQITSHHRMWRYCENLRKDVRGAARGNLAPYDSANAGMNITESVWPGAVDDFKEGYQADMVLLPEDLAFPAVITEPVIAPADVPAPPAGVTMPSLPAQQIERAFRRRRNPG